ncbi:hypothetical protein [[Eubacterium] hominis]|uniref:hypothetical protein n=1 Tax=[Eubacterium] hominis TaxID=2764325 RepID=UPI000E4E6326|nr:hypothetical protein DW716_16055 [Absiella sp. AM27-20]
MFIIVDFRDIFVKTFVALANDSELIKLLDIDLAEVTDSNERMGKIREQIKESIKPNDILNNNNTRLCIHPETGEWQPSRQVIKYLAVDVHITNDRDEIDRRANKIVKRIIEVLDTRERKLHNLKPLEIGLIGLQYKKDSAEESQSSGWQKYSVVFEYRFLKL